MELSVSGRQRRAAQAAQAAQAAPRGEKKPAGTGGGRARARPGSDRAAWSQGALAFLQEVNRQDMEARRKLLESKQRESGDLEAMSESLKVMDRCQKIASRIMKGDKVPPQDEMYLLDNDPDGYKLALACRVPKEKPKEWESVLEEEEREDGSSGSGGETAETVESAGETAEC